MPDDQRLCPIMSGAPMPSSPIHTHANNAAAEVRMIAQPCTTRCQLWDTAEKVCTIQLIANALINLAQSR